MNLPSNTPNLNSLPEDVIDEILGGEVFEVDMDEVSQLAGETPKTVWTNGTFDVLHMGHINLFKQAKELAGQSGKVIVGIDTDERVSQLKGPTRPINNLFDRVNFLRAIKYIDEIVTFSTDEALTHHIKRYSPDYFIIGNDYQNKTIIGGQHAKQIIFIPRYANLSTTQILQKQATK